MIHIASASAAAAAPPSTPMSNPTRPTHGASAIAPSFPWASKTSIAANVSDRPATAMPVTSDVRRTGKDNVTAGLPHRRRASGGRGSREQRLFLGLATDEEVDEHEGRGEEAEEKRGAKEPQHDDRARNSHRLHADDV